jgi:(R,R)-butanediol dehydrogenase/meso-butanediol dehydrogenase/diacetyl reductase
MRASVYHGAHDVRVEDVPEPQRGEGEVLLRVLRSGMCGTDATEWASGPTMFPVDRTHPVTAHSGPMVLGHEFVGEVLEAPQGGSFAVGDVVASGAGISCGECERCREGRTNLCTRYYTLGLNTAGGMAERVSVPERALARVPSSMSVDRAGLAQPMAVGLHAARRSGVQPGDRVVLIGAGAIGSFVLAGLRSLAEADVTVVDFPGSRLDRASRLGATRTVDAGPGVDRVS